MLGDLAALIHPGAIGLQLRGQRVEGNRRGRGLPSDVRVFCEGDTILERADFAGSTGNSQLQCSIGNTGIHTGDQQQEVLEYGHRERVLIGASRETPRNPGMLHHRLVQLGGVTLGCPHAQGVPVGGIRPALLVAGDETVNNLVAESTQQAQPRPDRGERDEDLLAGVGKTTLHLGDGDQ